MSTNSSIEWTDTTWNPTLGCDRVSPGCDGCYAITQARIRSGNPNPKVSTAFAGLTHRENGRLDWTGQINQLPDRLDQPLHWRKPRRIFVNSLSDLFHKDVPEEFIAQVWTVMAATPQHTYQILTKRQARMRSVVRRIAWRTPTTEERRQGVHGSQAYVQADEDLNRHLGPPRVLPNVHLGVSVENQHWAEVRIPALLDTPAAVRFISAEPLLGPIRLSHGLYDWDATDQTYRCRDHGMPDCAQSPQCNRIDWVIVGGESGPGARPMHPDWALRIVEQCRAAGTAPFVKQLGAAWARDWHVGGRSVAAQGDPKGGNWDFWPSALRVREYPGGAA